MVKSTYKSSLFFSGFFGLFGISGLIFFAIRTVHKMLYVQGWFNWGRLTILAFFIILICIFTPLFSSMSKYIFLNNEKNSLRFRSLFHPFGKTLYFKDFIGIYKTTETGSEGTYDVVYLVDKNNITRLKIMGLYYKNMDEIVAAIPLPEIKKNLSAGQYFKLMFTGRANLSKIKPKNKSKKTTETTENKIGKYMRIFIAVAFLIFVITMIIRIVSKL
jgi:hypothetical protein